MKAALRRKSPARLWLPLLVASAGTSLAQSAGWDSSWDGPSNDEYWPKHFRVGAMAGFNIKADFKMSGTFAVSGYNPGGVFPGTDHVYDDGYVRVDELGNAQG